MIVTEVQSQNFSRIWSTYENYMEMHKQWRNTVFYLNFSIAFQKFYKIHFLMIYYLGREKNLRVTEEAKKKFQKVDMMEKSILPERDITT